MEEKPQKEQQENQEEEQKNQEIIQEESLLQEFQCFICYEIPLKPTFTKCCKQITCKQHIIGFQDKCPFCRNTPFEIQDDEVRSQKILEIHMKNKEQYEIKLKKLEEMEAIQCKICLLVPSRPLKSKCCLQNICYKHICSFDDNKCSLCQQKPFQYTEDKDFQQKIMKIKIEEYINDNKNLYCKEKECKFKGSFDQIKEHYLQEHKIENIDYNYIEKSIETQELKDIVNAKLEAGIIKRRRKVLKELYILHLRELRQPSYGVKKYATPQQKAQMRNHTTICNHPECLNLFSGPWGPFIGGEQSRTHFHLTQCPQGKQLNVEVGWNYDNPAY